MDNRDLELFKQAISEGLSNKLDKTANSYDEEIVCSEKHKLAMRTIVYGETPAKKQWSPGKKRAVAILVAAALLLTSCGIIFRNEIREIFEEFFASVTFYGDESNPTTLEEIYILSYIPDGYALDKEITSPVCVQYTFVDENSNIIKFEQRNLSDTSFVLDSESGYSKIIDIEEYNVYYRYTAKNNCYVWTDEKYSLTITSNTALPNEEIVLIIEGISTK